MINVNELIKKIEHFAPLELAQEWDNSGWQINLGNEKANNVLFALSLTNETLQQAIENKCDLIITHHPLIFNGIKTIEYSNVIKQIIIDCIKNNVQIYSAHTNLDVAQGGVNDVLCNKLGLYSTETIKNFVKITELNEYTNLDEFITKLKINLNIEKIKLINPESIKQIKKIALCAGSGADFISDLKDIDLYITGDIKYHNALDVKGFAVIDAGHFETEKEILIYLKNLLNDIAPNSIIANESSPWIII